MHIVCDKKLYIKPFTVFKNIEASYLHSLGFLNKK